MGKLYLFYWRINWLIDHHHHHHVRAASEGRRVVAPPCPCACMYGWRLLDLQMLSFLWLASLLHQDFIVVFPARVFHFTRSWPYIVKINACCNNLLPSSNKEQLIMAEDQFVCRLCDLKSSLTGSRLPRPLFKIILVWPWRSANGLDLRNWPRQECAI